MKAIFISFKQFLLQISRDSMLLVICLSPIITGIVFKFAIPIAERVLCNYFEKVVILSPYYLLFDIFLAIITPYMFCFASAMVILEEKDTNITNYLSVTPVGKTGYLLSRLGFPAVISAAFSAIILIFFSLTDTDILIAVALATLTSPIGVIISLLIVSLSSNKVEGMAIAKLGGLIILGVAIPFFITDTRQYWGAFLPSFWVTKIVIAFSTGNLLIGIGVIAVWMYLLSHRFNKQIS
ncbi:MAG: ABC transporter permease [Cellulosilyticaceae bacterium]